MKKILVVCGNGLGSSFMIEMNVKKVLNELGIEAEVSHTDLTTGQTEKADLYLGARDLVEVLDDGTRNVAKLTNILDLDELKRVLRERL
ncbi:PTS system, Lactose/Cellobiose specific IIB subunit [Geobacillus kaustophilus]|uniref:PTS system, Lactose/Cellobiose specific IIB subunit n=1 Tax=Geobacillus kaustophilus TaxID=1462 RepID=A0A0D8BZI8_GEOKU|nr:PTS sugar transporter subunit IIB [Geobacillus kaustophilus]KJE28787.1 PTS system, Lactose/Cellobiose specific IIB subunit [Geobacillus kaustophilus]